MRGTWFVLRWVLFLFAEVTLLISVGTWIGPAWTFALVLLTGLVGGSLARREGLSLLAELSHDLREGRAVPTRLSEGALILAGGLLLLTPGFLTDAIGLLLVAPPTRRRIAPALLRWLAAQVPNLDVVVGTMGAPRAYTPHTQRTHGRSDADRDRPRPGQGRFPFEHPVARDPDAEPPHA